MFTYSSSKVNAFLYGLLLFLTPLVMFPRTSELFEFNKILVIYLITGLIVSFWIARMIFAKKVIWRKTVLFFPLTFFIVSQILSTYYSIDHSTSFFGYYGRFNGGLLSIMAYCVLYWAYISQLYVNSQGGIRKQVESLLKISLIASFVVMFWGLPSHFGYDLTCLVFTGNLDVGCWTDQFKPTIRVFSTLGQPNWLAAYLVVHMCIGLYFYLKERMRNMHLVYGLYLSLTMVMLLYTRSRSALIALFVAMCLVGIYLIVRRGYVFRKKLDLHLKALFLIFVIPIIIIGTGVSSLDRVIKPTSWLTQEKTVSQKDDQPSAVTSPQITDSSAIRRIVWQGAYSLGIEYPLFGTGVETFAYSYNFTRPLDHNTTSEWDYVYNKAHNELFNYFATTGFVGLVAYLIIFGFVIIHVRKAFDGSLAEQDELLIMCLLAAYISISITNFFGFSTTTINLFYYLIPAWIVALVYGKSFQKYDDDVMIAEDDGLKLVVPVCIAIFTLWYCIQYFRADIAYAHGDSLFSSQEYAEALPHLYNAYSIRPEHIYADKISQIHAQQAYVLSLSGVSVPECPDVDGILKKCIDLSKKYNEYSLKKSPYNPGYYRTKARNHFVFYQFTHNELYYKNAIQAVDQARQIAPTDPKLPYLRALFALGYYETKKKPTQKDRDRLALTGLSSIQFAIQMRGNYTGAYYLKGLIQRELKDTEGARKTFNHILDSLDPHNEQVKQELKTL